jgi:hypothetical protein
MMSIVPSICVFLGLSNNTDARAGFEHGDEIVEQGEGCAIS